MSLAAHVRIDLGVLTVDAGIDAARGRTVALLGPNGAGKTTLLRALAGLRPIDGGRIAVDGETWDDADGGVFVAPEDRRVGFVFQDYVLFPHLDVVDNVAFGLVSRGTSRRDARAAALEALDRFSLSHRAGAKPRQLSGGESQRVALARALVTRPALLLLDEPLAALDVSTRTEVRRELRASLDDFDGVRIVVTHDAIEAAALAHELVVIEQGRVVQRGTPAELAAQPRSRYVADLAGVNLVTGRCRAGVIETGTGRLVVADHLADGDVLAVIHPRAVVLHRHRPEGTARNVWPAPVVAIDPEGERVRVRLGGPVPLVAEVTPGAVADLALAAGAEVWVAIKATEIQATPR